MAHVFFQLSPCCRWCCQEGRWSRRRAFLSCNNGFLDPPRSASIFLPSHFAAQGNAHMRRCNMTPLLFSRTLCRRFPEKGTTKKQRSKTKRAATTTTTGFGLQVTNARLTIKNHYWFKPAALACCSVAARYMELGWLSLSAGAPLRRRLLTVFPKTEQDGTGFCIPPKLSKRLAWSTFCGCMFLLRVSLKLIPETQAEGKGVAVITALATCAQVVRLDRLRRVDILRSQVSGRGRDHLPAWNKDNVLGILLGDHLLQRRAAVSSSLAPCF